MRCTLPSCLAVAVALGGCNAYYAPPVRAFQYGAPARLEAGRVEVGGTAGGFAIPDIGGPHVGVGITDAVAIEAGGNFWLDAGRQSWAMGWLGPRFSYAPHRERRVHFIGDLELGAGVGVGGVRDSNSSLSDHCMDCDGRSGLDRLAGGGYGGIGLGVQIAWVSLYARARVEMSTADNVPTTVWPSASVGAEFNYRKKFAVTIGGGYIGYVNGSDHIDAWFYQLGAVMFFDAWKPRRAPERSIAPTVTPPRPLPVAPAPDDCRCDDDGDGDDA